MLGVGGDRGADDAGAAAGGTDQVDEAIEQVLADEIKLQVL